MRSNPDHDIIRRVLSQMPDATESEKRAALRDACPYRVSALAHKGWIKAVNTILSEPPKAPAAIKNCLPGHEEWIAKHMK